MELLRQALAGLQEDRRSMQGTVEQLKSVETQQLASKIDVQAQLLRAIVEESAGNRQALLSEQDKVLQQLEAMRQQDQRTAMCWRSYPPLSLEYRCVARVRCARVSLTRGEAGGAGGARHVRHVKREATL